MNLSIKIVLCLLCVGLAACGTRISVSPFEGEVPLTYTQASGKLSIVSEVGDFQFSLPTSNVTLAYSVIPAGDTLLWEIEAEGQYLGFKQGKRVKAVTINEVFGLYPLEDSHAKLAFTIRTDPLGTVIGVERYANAESGSARSDDYWRDYYLSVFSMVFPPFLTPSAQMDTVVSRGNVVVPPERTLNFPTPEVRLTGMKKKFGKQCIVLQYESTSKPYKNAARQKCIDTLEVYSMLDQQTRIVHNARAVLRGKNAIYFTRIKPVN